MKQTSHGMVYCIMVLVASLSLPACSSISQTVSKATAYVNPFQQQAEEAPPAAAPAEEQAPAAPAASSIRVEKKQPPAAPPRTQVQQKQQPVAKTGKDVEVNLGGNKQCTTFCALPMRKPPAAQ